MNLPNLIEYRATYCVRPKTSGVKTLTDNNEKEQLYYINPLYIAYITTNEKGETVIGLENDTIIVGKKPFNYIGGVY